MEIGISLEQPGTKSFPDQPSYNVGAALGFLFGLGFAVVAIIASLPLPGVSQSPSDWISNIVSYAISGALVGAAIGYMFEGRRN